MKKFSKLFISLFLAMFLCLSCGEMKTVWAVGEEGDVESDAGDGDEYEDFNQEEGEIDDDAEPQIWYSEGVPYHDPVTPAPIPTPSPTPAFDIWSGEIDMSEIPEGLADGIIYAAHTTVGTIVIHDSAYIYRIVDGEITQVWDYYAEAKNVIFDASEYYVDPHNRWYGYVGNSLVHFTEDDMIVDVVSCTEFEYSGMYMYCYHAEAGILYATSPCNNTPILGEVIEIYTKEGHTFVRRPDGTYLITVPPYLISQMSQQYCDEHPIPYIYLGNDDWYGYYMQLDTRNSGKSQSETTMDFDVKYGLTSVTWGYPTTNFSPMSVELAAGKSYQQVYDYYDIAFERDGGGYFKVGDIDFADSLGFLTYEFDGDMPSRVTWESYIASEEAFADIQQYLADEGYNCLGETNSGAGDKEYSYTIDGGYIMRVVYKNSEREGAHVFVYVDY